MFGGRRSSMWDKKWYINAKYADKHSMKNTKLKLVATQQKRNNHILVCTLG
jgi:hypothetical protein